MRRKNSFHIHLLSLVMPTYKQEKTILKDIKNVIKALDALEYKYEIIVVIDGIVDGTYKKAAKLKSKKIKILSYEKNQGKGNALRYGLMYAKGDIVGLQVNSSS